jgi:tudor domain-containing protein 1/4/6/7
MDLKAAFPLGQKVDVYVTHLHDESANFFVQLNNEEAGKLDDLMAEIESFISSGGSQCLTAGEIEIGVVYLAQYSEDARWYRARVEAVKAGLCDVYFIDYGNTEQIPLKFVRQPQPSFLKLHPQAFECALEGISKFRGPHFKDAVSTLKTLILEQELSCVTTLINSNVLIVNLFKDINCQDSILSSLLSQVQRTPQATTTESREPVQKKPKKFKTESLSVDDYRDFCVTDVEDPYSFSCQIVENSEALLDMMDEIAKEYEDLKPGDLQLQSSSSGYPCCSKFSEDVSWYRAVITKSSSVASGFLDVKFVDYGNTQTTPVSDVKDLKDKFLELPVQALDCSLHGIKPENNSSEWSADAKALFSKLTKNKHIVGLICGKNPDGKYKVKLVDTTGEMDMQVDQILIAAKYAEKTSDQLRNVARSQSGRSPSSEQTSPQSNNKTQEIKRTAPFPYTKEVLTPGKEEKVLVSSVTSPSLFYCMMYRTSTDLEKLMSDIKRHYSRLGADDEWLANPSVGDPCCAKFPEDQSWYRALVTDVSSPGKVEVLFIDYGNSERVQAKSVKRLAPQFSELNCQGIKCSLNRICPKGSSDWRSVDVKTFEELALECTGKLTVIALQDDGLHRVELVVFDKGKEVNLTESLLLKGNATLVDGAVAQSENLASVTSKKFAKVTLTPGVYEDVFVSHVEDPANFWCQLLKHQDDLNNVMTAIHDYCSSSSDVIRNPSLGGFT